MTHKPFSECTDIYKLEGDAINMIFLTREICTISMTGTDVNSAT